MHTATNSQGTSIVDGSVHGDALVVDDELSNRVILKALLKRIGYQVVEARNGREAVELFQAQRPDVIFMDVMMPEMDGYAATMQIKALTEEHFVPVIFLTALTDEEALVRCIEAGGDDFLTKPFSHAILRSKLQAMERIRALHQEVNTLYNRMRQEEEIAQKVFSTAVVAGNVAMHVIPHRLQSAAIFSGDLFLTAQAPSGDLHLLLGDFTGHGLSAALGALPTAEVFRTMTAKGFAPEQILASINRKLHTLLPTGMFLAASFVRVPHTLDYVQIFNCGLPDCLILDQTSGTISQRIVSRLLPLGILPRQNMSEGLQHVPIMPGWRVLLASDGVTEAHGPGDALFGQARFEAAIAASAGASTTLDAIDQALDHFCGQTPQADDISLVEIPCVPTLFPSSTMEPIPAAPSANPAAPLGTGTGETVWQVGLSLCGARVGQLDPVPLLINQIQELEGVAFDSRSLFTVLTELYVNAVDHGILKLTSSLKADAEGFVRYFQEREQRLAALTTGMVQIRVVCEQVGEERRLRIQVEDSGGGFDHETALAVAEQDPHRLHGRGLLLVNSLCTELTYSESGNVAEAVFQLTL